MRKKKPLLLRAFPVAQYLGAAVVLMAYTLLPDNVWLLPGVEGSRRWLLIWALVLLALAWLSDSAYLRAWKKDAAELRDKAPNGNLNRSTMLALCVPALLLADLLAVIHVYMAYRGVDNTIALRFSMGGLSMAIGIVLWIYGRRLPWIQFGSVWGIRNKAAMTDQTAWGNVHLRASKPVYVCGLAALICAALLPDAAGLALACLCCAAAFLFIYRPIKA